ncbi:MAG: hypothetical protein ACKPEY_16400 [Planctomycetota bacterium]
MTDWESQPESADSHRSAKLAAALHDVQIPPGLAERLLAKLDESPLSRAEAAVLPDRTAALPSSTNSPVFAADPQRRTRRLSLAWMVASVAVVSLMGLVGSWMLQNLSRRAPLTVQSLDELSQAPAVWTTQLTADWHANGEPVPAGYELGAPLRYSHAPWQIIATDYDPHAVAYQLASAGDACLFVVETSCEFLEDGGPCRRLPASAGWDVGAWRRGSHLFLLAARDHQRRLEEFLQPPASNVALASRR